MIQLQNEIKKIIETWSKEKLCNQYNHTAVPNNHHLSTVDCKRKRLQDGIQKKRLVSQNKKNKKSFRCCNFVAFSSFHSKYLCRGVNNNGKMVSKLSTPNYFHFVHFHPILKNNFLFIVFLK